jgi:tRNA threonylcarbamoyladenosine biosynthesis protein TsaE
MIEISSAQEMQNLGALIGSQLRAGDLILLNGELGAGKTVLVQGIVQALGIKSVTSPTFVISKSYPCRCLPTIRFRQSVTFFR